MLDPTHQQITWADYASFIIMISLSTTIGIYYGIFKKRENTIEEYMFGGRRMPVIPVCLSNMASIISSVLLVAGPRETYYFGALLIYVPLSQLTVSAMLYFFYLPVFYHLEYTSIFEYLEKRFNKTTRCIGSAVFTITQIFFVLVIMYSACTAVTQAIEIPYYIFTPFICVLCTIYTALGGLRGVVWTDFLQALFMFVSLLTVIVLGILRLDNGIQDVFTISSEGGRINLFSLDLDPFVRYSPWTAYISGVALALTNACTNPGVMQRYLSLPTYSKAKLAVIVSGFTCSIFTFLNIFLGLVIYANYHDCDPGMSKALNDTNQLVTYYVTDVAKNVPGLTGLFLSGVLSAALSTMSTIMNGSSCTIFEDLVKPLLPWKLTNVQCNYCMKSIVLLFGIIVSIGIFGLNAVGGIFQLFRTLTSLTAGLIIFVFGFGLFYRNANCKGVITGAISGVILTICMGIGSQSAISSGRIQYATKIISIEGCPGNLSEIFGINATVSGSEEYLTPVIFADDVPYLYRISFNLISTTGVLVSILIGLIISVFTSNDKQLNEKLVIPQIRKTVSTCDYSVCQELDDIRPS